MHFGATLRLLRMASGMGLRDLARRLGVSGSYLSRVENGIDPTPTRNRLEALAKELDIPPTLLMELAHQLSPLVSDYLDREPEAGTLFLQIAHRRLSGAQLAKVRAFIDNEFPLAADPSPAQRRQRAVDLLSSERIVLGLTCTDMDDVIDVAVGRMRGVVPAAELSRLSAAVAKRERESGSFMGGGIVVPSAYVAQATPAAAMVTLASPLACAAPDALPVRLMILLVAPPDHQGHLVSLAQIAHLSARGLVDRVCAARTPEQALQQMEILEAWRG